MKVSISTVTIAGDLSEKLAAIAASGFDGIEIFEQDLIAFDGSPKDIGTMAGDHGLSVDLFQPLHDLTFSPDTQRSRAFDRAERKFDLMQELGCELLLVGSTTHDRDAGGFEQTSADLRELGERAARRGLRIGYEALAWGKQINDYRDAWNLVRCVDHAAVGLVLDSFHILKRGSDLGPLHAIPGERIFHVQLADAPMIEMNVEHLSRHYRMMPGEGDLPLEDFMKAVAATGYSGPLSLEVLNDQFRAGNARVIAVDGKRSLLWLVDEISRAIPEIPPALAPPPMPARIPIEGVEFVEFTASQKEAEELGRMLRTLGFNPAARHLSKDVTLWRQGKVNLVINSQSEGFAHSAYIMHGMSVCDIGLMVEDAGAAVERARTLGANPFFQRHRAGELNIPAVRGMGGSVLHFLDTRSELGRVWETEFRPITPDAPVKAAGLSRIDHFAQVTTFEEMQTWALFYAAIFKVIKTPTVDIADPSGLVHSRAIESPDGRFRLTLNGAETHRTLAGRFIADSFGSSVQHLAFATDDLFETAAQLAENGFEPLPIPQNYYANLDAQFDLDASFQEKLRIANILYDEDETGSYLQLYSKPYTNGFFFEIVERRGAYNGYAAPNAPYRTAAQKRLSRPAASSLR